MGGARVDGSPPSPPPQPEILLGKDAFILVSKATGTTGTELRFADILLYFFMDTGTRGQPTGGPQTPQMLLCTQGHPTGGGEGTIIVQRRGCV